MAFDFRPPLRSDGTVADAGIPSHAYQPGRGKRGNLRDPETGRLFGKTSVSANAPEEFKSPVRENEAFLESQGRVERLVFNRNDPSNAKPRAAGLHSVEQGTRAEDFVGRRGRNIRDEAGKMYNQTGCSMDSPRWFKRVFEDNRDYLRTHGVSDEVWFEAPYEKDPHVTKQQNKVGSPPSRREAGRAGSQALNASLAVSPTSPDWMMSPMDANRRYLEETGSPPPRRNSKRDDVFAEYPIGKKSLFRVHPENGNLLHSQVVSCTSPRWMRSPILSNKAYFEKEANCKLKEVAKTERERPGKRQHIKDPETGETVRKNMVSGESVPEWMIAASRSCPPERCRAPESVSSQATTRDPRALGTPETRVQDRRSSKNPAASTRRTSDRKSSQKQPSSPTRRPAAQRSSGRQQIPGRKQEDCGAKVSDSRHRASTERAQPRKSEAERARGQR